MKKISEISQGMNSIYSCGLNKGIGSKFTEYYRLQQKAHEEGLKTQRPKRCEYNDQDEDNSLWRINNNIF